MIYNTIPYHSMNDLNSHQSRSRLGLAVAASSYSSPEWAALRLLGCALKLKRSSPKKVSITLASNSSERPFLRGTYSYGKYHRLSKQLWKCHPIQQFCTDLLFCTHTPRYHTHLKNNTNTKSTNTRQLTVTDKFSPTPKPPPSTLPIHNRQQQWHQRTAPEAEEEEVPTPVSSPPKRRARCMNSVSNSIRPIVPSR